MGFFSFHFRDKKGVLRSKEILVNQWWSWPTFWLSGLDKWHRGRLHARSPGLDSVWGKHEGSVPGCNLLCQPCSMCRIKLWAQPSMPMQARLGAVSSSPQSSPQGHKLGSQREVAVLIIMSINAAAAPQLPDFWPQEEPHGLGDRSPTSQIWPMSQRLSSAPLR